MNERIFELKNDALDWAMNNLDPDLNEYEWEKEIDKKFAELIVKECIGVIEGKMPEFTCKEEHDNLYRKAGRLDAIDEIKEHFGVEE